MSTTQTARLGKDLRAGDLVKGLWRGDQFIVSLKPYSGSLEQHFDGGAQIAAMSPSGVSIRIDNNAAYTVLRSQVENIRSDSENTAVRS